MPTISLTGPLGSGVPTGIADAQGWVALQQRDRAQALDRDNQAFQQDLAQKELELEDRALKLKESLAAQPTALAAIKNTPLVEKSPIPGVEFDPAMTPEEFSLYGAQATKDQPEFLFKLKDQKQKALFAQEGQAVLSRLTKAAQSGAVQPEMAQKITELLSDDDPTSTRLAWAAIDMAEDQQAGAMAQQVETARRAAEAQTLLQAAQTTILEPAILAEAAKLAAGAGSSDDAKAEESLMQLRILSGGAAGYHQQKVREAEERGRQSAMLEAQQDLQEIIGGQLDMQMANASSRRSQFASMGMEEPKPPTAEEKRAKMDKAHGKGESNRRGVKAVADAIEQKQSPEAIKALISEHGLIDGVELREAVRSLLESRKSSKAGAPQGGSVRRSRP